MTTSETTHKRLPIVATRVQALDLLEKAVESKGKDFVYERITHSTKPSCVYVRKGKPSCLVANALALAGITVGQLRRVEGKTALVLPPAWVSEEAAHVFDTAQRVQDEGEPWGLALEQAKRNV